MSTLALSGGTLTASLWGTKEPVPKASGLLLHVSLDSLNCTALASDSGDITRHCIGTSDGSVFLLHFKKNRASMISKLPQSISALTFSPSRRDQILCASGQLLFIVNSETCRIEHKARSPHFNAISVIATDSAHPTTAVTVSIDAIAVWNTNELVCRKNSRETLKSKTSAAQFLSARLSSQTDAVLTLEHPGVLCWWTLGDLTPLKRVSVGADVSLSAMVGCSSFVVAAGATKPELFFLHSANLEGISAVSLPGTAPAKRLDLIDEQLCAIQTADARVWFLSVADYSLNFTLSFPFTSPVTSFAVSGATYMTVSSGKDVYVYHLPSVKRNYDRGLTGNPVPAAASKSSGASSLLPFVRTQSDTSGDAPPETAETYAADLPRHPVHVDSSAPDKWVKANLVNRHDAVAGAPRSLLLNDAVKSMYAEDAGISSRGATSSGATAAGGNFSSLSSAVMARKALRKGSAEEGTAASRSGRPHQQPGTSASRSTVGDSHQVTTASRASNIAARSFLDRESRAVNMDKLRGMLLRYGMYPDKYRTMIWRFLLQLPEKRFLAPQFCALSEKGPHPGVETLMSNIPLPRNKQRAVFEAALSALAWNSPVLSVVHFVPHIVFPFAQLYGSDTQSVVEVVLSFLVNWGKEFFTYYPHRPVAVLSYLHHLLKMEDLEVWNHLEELGVGVDLWGWEVMWPVYTEVLTRNEWLQVMDHALSNEPIWLLLFHVRWIVQLRDVLLQLHDHSQLVALLRKATPINLNTVIHQTYSLRQRCPLGTIAEPYLKFVAFQDYAYPVILECDQAVITSKVRELDRIALQQEEAKKSRELVQDIQSRIAQAAMLEDAFVGKQRAIVAAKMDSANESWVQQVQLEKERQRLRDIEHETRLVAIQEQLRSAQRLEALQQEMNSATQSARDAEVDRQREVSKWDFSDRMTQQEMDRLEMGARMKLHTILSTSRAVASLQPGNECDILQLARQEDAIPPVIPHSLVAETTAVEPSHGHPASQQQEAAGVQPSTGRRTVVPPAVVVLASERTQPQPQETRDDATMTELPPLPPPSSTRSDTSSVRPSSQVPQPTTAGAAAAVHVPGKPPYLDTTATTSVPETTAREESSSTCDVDPISYYRRLQESIKQGVARAQRDQQERMAALESRFARQLGCDDNDGSEVTEPVADDTTTTTSSTASGNALAGHRGGATAKRSQRHQLYDNIRDEASAPTQRPGGTTAQRRTAHPNDETCSLLASSAASTSMTGVFLRAPNDPTLADLIHADRPGGTT